MIKGIKGSYIGLFTLMCLFIVLSGCEYFDPFYTGTPTIQPTPAGTVEPIETPVPGTPVPTETSVPGTPVPTETPVPTGTPIGGTPTPTPRWDEVDLGIATTVSLGKTAVGPGRNDGVIHVYAGEAIYGNGLVHEYTYNGSTWDKSSITGSDVAEVRDLVIGDIRNNGTIGVYASGYEFEEYLYQTNAWIVGKRTSSIGWSNGFSIGDGRNNGYTRVYVAGGLSNIIELSYNSGAWNETIISTSNSVLGVVVSSGRNDGTNRLYAILGTTVYEYTWNTSTWNLADCSAVTSTPSGFLTLCSGNGRNDGVQRIYAWGDNGLHELSYDAGWTSVEVTSEKYEFLSDYGMITLADGRNDRVFRLYAAGDNGVGEYTFSGSWEKTALISTRKAGGVSVGNGRGDSTPINRVYISGGTHVFEYTFQAQ